MFYKLKPQFLLRGWQKLPYALVDDVTKRTVFVNRDEMDALRLCDGTVDLSLPLIPQSIRDLIPIIEREGVIVPCERGDTIELRQAYHQYPARYIRTAHWSITGHCNYRCKHCYMSAPDAKYGQLSHEEVMDIVRQLIDCGVMEVSLTAASRWCARISWKSSMRCWPAASKLPPSIPTVSWSPTNCWTRSTGAAFIRSST